MNSNSLKAAAASWLRYEKKCPLITFERGLGFGNPDVLGVNPSHFLIEVEVKISVSDFKVDAEKRKWLVLESAREHSKNGKKYKVHGVPKFFYYMVPMDLVDTIKPLMKASHGLITCSGYSSHTGYPIIREIISASVELLAERVTTKDFIRLVKHQSGTLCSLANSQAKAT